MRITCIRHISFEKIGVIEQWAQINGCQLTEIKSYLGEKLPKLDDFDLLVILGGPQSATELDKYIYLSEEIELIKQSVSAGKLLLGICLGAQLISVALGGETSKSAEKEIGIYQVNLTEEGKNSTLFSGFTSNFPCMQWHGDTFSIPKGAKLLASSEACTNQAFSYGDSVFGMQFHLEVTKEIVKDVISHCSEDLSPSKYTQSSNEIINSEFEVINFAMHKILNNLYSNFKKLS